MSKLHIFLRRHAPRDGSETDGMVIPAHSRCYNYPLVRAQDVPLTRIWNNARYTAFRPLLHEKGSSLPACTRCCGVVDNPL